MQDQGRDASREGEPGGTPRILPFPGASLLSPPEPIEIPSRRRVWTQPGPALAEGYLTAVFLLALIARVAAVVSPGDSYLGPGLVLDQLGLRIAVGLGFGPTSMLPPLYPHYLGLLYRICGYSHLAIVLSQALLGALTAVAAALLVRSAGMNRVLAAVAGLGVALYPQALAQTRHLSPQILTGLLFLVATLLFLRGRQTGSRIAVVASGLLFGVTVLGRSGLLVPAVAVLLTTPRGSWFAGRPQIAVLALLCAVVVPWNVRNSLLNDQPVILDSTWVLRLRAATIPGTEEVEYRVPGRFTEYPDAMEALDNRLAVSDVIGFTLTEPVTVFAIWGERLRELVSLSGWNDSVTLETFPYRGVWYRVAQALAQGVVLSLVLTWALLFRAPGKVERTLGIAFLGIAAAAMTGGGTGDARLYAYPLLVVLGMRGLRDLLMFSRVLSEPALSHDPGTIRRVIWASALLLMWLHGVGMWIRA